MAYFFRLRLTWNDKCLLRNENVHVVDRINIMFLVMFTASIGFLLNCSVCKKHHA